MIKKILLSFGLFLFGFINYVGACAINGRLSYVGQNFGSHQSTISNAYNVGVLNKGTFISQSLGLGKSIFALSDNNILFRDKDGLPYYYYGDEFQGNFQYYFVCDELNSGSTSLSNCSISTYEESSKQLIKSFMSTVQSTDYFGYFIGGDDYHYYYDFCQSSASIGKTMCFYHYRCRYNAQCPRDNCPLINSKGYTGLTFANIGMDIYGESPGLTGGNSGGSGNNINQNTTITTQCPTVGEIMQNYGDKYNTGLCYNNTKYFDGSGFVNVEKSDIFTIFDDNYENYTNRISIYRNNCNTPATNTACQNAFSGEYKKFSIINNAINSNVDEKRLRNYCNLGLNLDPNTSSCVANITKEPETAEEMLNNLINSNIGIITPTTESGNDNNVFNSLCEEGDEECFTKNNVRDIFGSLERIYAKITGLFKERNGVNGIIPNYILRITFITILFTIIFKK